MFSICFGISKLMDNPQYSLELGFSEQDKVQVGTQVRVQVAGQVAVQVAVQDKFVTDAARAHNPYVQKGKRSYGLSAYISTEYVQI